MADMIRAKIRQDENDFSIAGYCFEKRDIVLEMIMRLINQLITYLIKLRIFEHTNN